MSVAAREALSIDLAHLRGWIGRTEEATDIVTPRIAAQYRATFDPHLAPVATNEAPWMLQWCLTPPIALMSELTDEGHMKKGGFLPPVPLPRRMWAGGMVETRGRLRVGDTVRRRSRVEDVALKEGRSGRLCFVTVRHEYDAGGNVAIRERHDIVYREATSPDAKAAPVPPRARPTPDLAWDVEPTVPFLFRYSALMFNAHRIHYDLPYVTETEGYPGLVVHGPVQATLLFNIAATVLGAPPTTFTYRGLSPLIAPAPFRVCARRTDAGLRCWTENAAGAPCMEADALP